VALAADEHLLKMDYVMASWLTPRMEITETHMAQLSPILDMLGVRHVIFRGSPPQGVKPAFQSPDYWVLEIVPPCRGCLCPKRSRV